ncbi:hypothetical protein DU500_04245 [Haloplanus rubicundus]|uniref:Uncharacterized protein n=1 Tax=Haloplanus rubicundus TaxID=1547898 RepID=A0A345EA25_9EURY|nr:hypothetical protein [Haloplanus rubicundus]AXG05710.1 hypothetical protein DU500_04245 [Haloplanus rubicundus]AXG09047.1 hypothetical protein DU484_03760 [Haloplanus rubicundus]
MTDAPNDPTNTADTPADSDGDTPGGISKRTLIRLLVGFGIGIPILIEAITFLGLLDQQFGGGGGDDAGSGSTATETPTSAVGVGDDLLPETERSETLASAVLRETGGDRWPLSLTVEVHNAGDTDYEFQLLSVHLDDGRTVSGRTSTDRLAPGETRTITGEWSIPAGSTPRAVDVVALVYADGSVETVERRVDLAKIPVRGG